VGLQALALRDVPHGDDDAIHGAAGTWLVAEPLGIQPGVIATADAKLAVLARPCDSQASPERHRHARPVIGVNELLGMAPDDIGGIPAENPAAGRGDVGDCSLGVEDHDDVVRVLNERLEPQLAVAAFGLGSLELDQAREHGAVHGQDLLLHLIGRCTGDRGIVGESADDAAGGRQGRHRDPAPRAHDLGPPVEVAQGHFLDVVGPFARCPQMQCSPPGAGPLEYQGTLIGGLAVVVSTVCATKPLALTEEEPAALDPQAFPRELDGPAAEGVGVRGLHELGGGADDTLEAVGHAPSALLRPAALDQCGEHGAVEREYPLSSLAGRSAREGGVVPEHGDGLAAGCEHGLGRPPLSEDDDVAALQRGQLCVVLDVPRQLALGRLLQVGHPALVHRRPEPALVGGAALGVRAVCPAEAVAVHEVQGTALDP